MPRIEVGEYVRINKSSRFLGIGKIIKIVGNTVYVKMYINLPISFLEEDIKEYKHSHNIKDLIEAGDLVTYEIKGLKHRTYTDIVKNYADARTLENKLGVAYYSLEQINIKTILTKEQFAHNCYEVED